jgi:hypothetical protein
MRAQDFLYGELKNLKFRVSFPDEIVTTQNEIDDYAIKFAKWIINNRVEFFDDTSSGEMYTYRQYHSKYSMIELLEIFKKEKVL